MGDKPPPTSAPAGFPQQDTPAGMAHWSTHMGPSHITYEHPSAFAPPFSRQQQGQTAGPQHALSPYLSMANQQRTCPFDLSNVANALPQPAYPAQNYGQRYNGVTMGLPGTTSQVPPAQFGAPNTMGPVPAQQYYMSQHAPMGHFYPNPISPHPAAALAGRPALGYYSNHLVVPPALPGAQFYRTPASSFSGQSPHIHGQVPLAQYGVPNLHQHPDPRTLQPQLDASSAAAVQQENEFNGSRQTIVRGPPRKPRQSGHAIWIGNLPPQTDLMSLVHHVCKETDGLESLFLISKSNCAFANFKDEQSCSAAQRKLHDSKFMNVRLVSRLRKSTVEGPAGATAPTGPAASASQAGVAQDAGLPGGAESAENGTVAPTPAGSVPEAEAATPCADGASSRKDRFFILKSLTVEDLELSVRTNIWATQSHNEERLNSAFETSDNVYLVFSANKSGEYFGYARMVSAVNDDPAAAIAFAPSAQSASGVDLPKAIPTEPTEFAPRGRIIDDSARGTIFWEADRDEKGAECGQDDEGGSGGSVGGDTGSVRSGLEGSGSGAPKAWGKPFRLEWLSTARLPFYRTRGLRNPWNSNREVKIARDGTELEPSVGRRLIGLFSRAQSPAFCMLPGVLPQMAPVGFPPVPPQ